MKLSPFSSHLFRGISIIVAILFCSYSSIHAQATIQLNVDSGISSTTCNGIFGLPPQTLWTVQVNGETEVTYPRNGNCFTNFPNVQYTSPPYTCHFEVPEMIEVCFTVFEYRGLFCDDSQRNCEVTICENFPIPIATGESRSYTLALPQGEDSGGEVNFTLSVLGDYEAAYYDDPCTALDLGTLTADMSLGSIGSSAHYNRCANQNGMDTELTQGVGWTDNQGLWFTFKTAGDPLDLVRIDVISDPANLGDPISAQVILYEVDDNCSDFNYVTAVDSNNDDDEILFAGCLNNNSTYLIIVDGVFGTTAGIEGYFDLQITNEAVTQAGDLRCDAEALGTLTEGGNLSAVLQTNNCATPSLDPFPSSFFIRQTVWYNFIAPPSGHVIIDAINHTPAISDQLIDLQLALYETNSGTCIGSPSEISSSYDNQDVNETLDVQCLVPGQMYWIMVDGNQRNMSAVFDLSVSDGGIYPPETDQELTICFGESITVGTSVYDEAGTYIDVLTASNGCDSTVTTTLIILPELSVETSEDIPATLEDTADGAASAMGFGGTPPYTYLWSNNATTSSISNLLPGNYCVTISDAAGCTAESCIEVSYLGIIEVQTTDDELACFGDNNGSLFIGATGGMPPYTYNWENQTDLSLQGNGTIATDGGSASLSNLTAGTYSITVTGSGGLFTIATTTITQPNEIITTLNQTLCFGESLQIGNTTYNTSGAINEILQAANGCDSIVNGTINILALNTFDNIVEICDGDTYTIGTSTYNATGTYDDVLLDSNGCDSLVTTFLTKLDEITISINIDNIASGYNIADANISISATGGTGNYTYQWSTGQTTTQANNINGGENLCIAITDDLGCTAQVCEFIPYSGDNLATIVGDDIACAGNNNGKFTLSTDAGLIPFSYNWQNMDTGSIGNGIIMNEGNETIKNLFAGNYSVTVIDANGINTVLETKIIEPDKIDIDIVSNLTPTCIGDCDGSFIVNATGGVGSYRYNWAAPDITGNSATGLCAGTFMLTVSDNNNCENVFSIVVNDPPPISLSANEVNPVACFGGSDGEATVDVDQNISSVLWDNGETTIMATQLDAGIHTVTITNANNCEATASVMITQPNEPLGASFTIIDPILCHGNRNGEILIETTGAGTSFEYLWSGTNNPNSFSSGSFVSNLAADIYMLTITNENGCTAIETITLPQPDLITFDVNIQDATCLNDGNNGAISVVSASGGVGDYEYGIMLGDYSPNNNFNELSAGLYNVYVEDLNGCTEALTVNVNPPPALEVEVPDNIRIDLGESVELTAFANSSNAVYNWNPSSTSDSFLNVQPTSNTLYEVIVTDTITHCSETASVYVTVDVERNLYIPNAFSPNNDGVNDAFTIYGGFNISEIRSLMIFDRLGNLLYQEEGLTLNAENEGWKGQYKGKDVKEGVFVFLAEIEFVDGKVIQYSGDITLMR